MRCDWPRRERSVRAAVRPAICMSRSTSSPHDFFVRDGDDLHCTITVPMVDAALGTTVIVEGILDGPTEITIGAGTQPG